MKDPKLFGENQKSPQSNELMNLASHMKTYVWDHQDDVRVCGFTRRQHSYMS